MKLHWSSLITTPSGRWRSAVAEVAKYLPEFGWNRNPDGRSRYASYPQRDESLLSGWSHCLIIPPKLWIIQSYKLVQAKRKFHTEGLQRIERRNTSKTSYFYVVIFRCPIHAKLEQICLKSLEELIREFYWIRCNDCSPPHLRNHRPKPKNSISGGLPTCAIRAPIFTTISSNILL